MKTRKETFIAISLEHVVDEILQLFVAETLNILTVN